jgi:hypothetical protein
MGINVFGRGPHSLIILIVSIGNPMQNAMEAHIPLESVLLSIRDSMQNALEEGGAAFH